VIGLGARESKPTAATVPEHRTDEDAVRDAPTGQ
jgi:hypothetical protein